MSATDTALDPARVDATDPRGFGSPAQWSVIVGRTLFVLALVGTWCLIYVFGLSRVEQYRSQHALYDQMRTQLAAGTAPVSEPIGVGSPIGTLAIPTLGISDLVIVEGTTSSALEDGPGHLRGTPLPGQVGQSFVFGRGTSFGGPFRDIVDLRRGDGIRVVTGQGTFVYAVIDVRGAGDPEPVAPTGSRSLLTLATARGTGPLGWLAPNRAVYVDAVQQKAGLPSTALPLPVSSNELVLAEDTSLVTRLELILSAMLVLACAGIWIIWRLRRWGLVARWVVGAPVFFASAWVFSDIAIRMLPNVF